MFGSLLLAHAEGERARPAMMMATGANQVQVRRPMMATTSPKGSERLLPSMMRDGEGEGMMIPTTGNQVVDEKIKALFKDTEERIKAIREERKTKLKAILDEAHLTLKNQMASTTREEREEMHERMMGTTTPGGVPRKEMRDRMMGTTTRVRPMPMQGEVRGASTEGSEGRGGVMGFFRGLFGR